MDSCFVEGLFVDHHRRKEYSIMIGTDYSLELNNVFHSGQIEPATCFQSLFGTVQTGLILKDVSMDVKAGEVLAVLGSKGSGKRALLEVIARRSHGVTRGQILLDGSPMTQSLFQRSCAFVSHRTQLIPTLSVEQTVLYSAHLSPGPKVSPYLRASRIKQVLADLALSQVARWSVSKLSISELRRLIIGTQLIRDPAVLLLDEPTTDLDPLTTYLVVSMLSNHAKRRGRIVVLTMEKPRSDVFPFLDRVTYLCLGDVVYTGPTRLMLEYFRAIGFPCPQLENPLMYYLCLSTVDRRSRQRFIESNSQIVALVEKFKMEGVPYRKSSVTPSGHLLSSEHISSSHKIQYTAFKKPTTFTVACALFQRLFGSTFCLSSQGIAHLFMRFLAMPIFFTILWFFYRDMQNYQWTFVSRNGLLFTCLSGCYFTAICNTAYTFSVFRNRYYEESRDGLYSGPLFLFTYFLFSISLSFISTIVASYIVFQTTGLKHMNDWYKFAAILWACYLLAEQQTISIMLLVKSSFLTIICSSYFSVMSLILASGALRSYRSIPEWLIYFTYITQTRYASGFLNGQMFGDGRLYNLPREKGSNCVATGFSSEQFACRYLDGGAYLAERYNHETGDYNISDVLDSELNMVVTFVLPVSLAVFNCLLYLLPLPTFVKSKFRD